LIGGCCWKALETWLHHEESRDFSPYILSQVKSFGSSYFYPIFNVPLCINICSTYLQLKVTRSLHVLVLYLACIFIWCASYLLVLIQSSMSMLVSKPYTVVLVLSLYWICWYLSCLLWYINELSQFGGVLCLVRFTILKICVCEENQLELILQDYRVSMWYATLMRNSNYNVHYSHRFRFYLPLVEKNCFITLWGSNIPWKCVHLRLC
jgi:hypothetical protein